MKHFVQYSILKRFSLALHSCMYSLLPCLHYSSLMPPGCQCEESDVSSTVRRKKNNLKCVMWSTSYNNIDKLNNSRSNNFVELRFNFLLYFASPYDINTYPPVLYLEIRLDAFVFSLFYFFHIVVSISIINNLITFNCIISCRNAPYTTAVASVIWPPGNVITIAVATKNVVQKR